VKTDVDQALQKLMTAVESGRSKTYCLRRWSQFIRARDGHQCVLCHGTKGLSAHHIIRKSFLSFAQFSPGNGITLCSRCHAEPHEAFNGRPDLALPMDTQGGEGIDFAMGLFLALAEDAIERNQTRLEYYFLSDEVLAVFKRFQELPESAQFPGTPVEQAYWIWRQSPRSMMFAVAEANGIQLPRDLIQRPGLTIPS
jgi:hypothetical protein